MAGSLSHIIGEDGHFTMDLIDELGDAHEALEQCFALIYSLSDGNIGKVKEHCAWHGFYPPDVEMKLD
jgi:hypothetical protein